MRINRPLVATLALVAGLSAAAAAEDRPFDLQPADPPPGGVGTIGAGSAMSVGGGRQHGGTNRQVFLQGVVDLDYISQTNYQDGNKDLGDHRDNGLIRSELGARVELDERIEAKITVAYQSETGGSNFVPGSTTDKNSASPVVLDDGYVVLKEFLNTPQLSVKAGRMPEVWNLRTDFGAFLYDSRANYPAVTSWDGVRARYNLESLTFTPYAYHLPDDSRLYGVAVDWQPEEGAGNNLFVTGSANVERGTVVPTGPYGSGLEDRGKTLFTYYGGLEAKFDVGFDIWGEGALQSGSQTSDITYKGYGFSAGMDWRSPTVTQFAIGTQLDYLSGDDNPTDGSNRAFVNNWEGVSDTYIVESEKYGEISRYAQDRAGLQAAKGRMEVGLPPDNRFRFKAVYGYYRLAQAVAGAKRFGQEIDLTATWQYTYNATFNLLGGVFLPDRAFEQVAPVGPVKAGNDPIWLFGVNLSVAF